MDSSYAMIDMNKSWPRNWVASDMTEYLELSEELHMTQMI